MVALKNAGLGLGFNVAEASCHRLGRWQDAPDTILGKVGRWQDAPDTALTLDLNQRRRLGSLAVLASFDANVRGDELAAVFEASCGSIGLGM